MDNPKHFYVVGLGNTEKECWENFDRNLQELLAEVPGFPFWRVPPEYEEEHDFEYDVTHKRVRGRIIISDKKIKRDFENIRGIPAFKDCNTAGVFYV